MFTSKPFWKFLAVQDQIPTRIEKQLALLYEIKQDAEVAWRGIDSLLDYCEVGSELFSLMRDYNVLSQIRARIANIHFSNINDREALMRAYIYMVTGMLKDRSSVEELFDSIPRDEFGGSYHSRALAILCWGDFVNNRTERAITVYQRIPKIWGAQDIVRASMVEELCLLKGERDRANKLTETIENAFGKVKALIKIYRAFGNEEDLHKARRLCSNMPYKTGGFTGGISFDRPCADILLAQVQNTLEDMEFPVFDGRPEEYARWRDMADSTYSQALANGGNIEEALREARGISNSYQRAKAINKLIRAQLITILNSDYQPFQVLVPRKDCIRIVMAMQA